MAKIGRPSIYGLYDKHGRLRYIGKANNPEERLKSHMRDSRRRDTPVYRWIRKNGEPRMEVLEADCVDWKESERRLIAEARGNGVKLLNVAEGGDEPFCSIEVRKANAAKVFGNMRAGLKPDGSQYTYPEVVIDTYERLMVIARNVGRLHIMQMVAERMIARYSQDPVTYSRWKNIQVPQNV